MKPWNPRITDGWRSVENYSYRYFVTDVATNETIILKTIEALSDHLGVNKDSAYKSIKRKKTLAGDKIITRRMVYT